MLPDNHFFFFDFTLDHTKITPAFAPATDEYDKSSPYQTNVKNPSFSIKQIFVPIKSPMSKKL